MKKLLHVQLLPLLSGVQRFSLHLLDGLNPAEFEIWIACKPGGEFVEELKARGYHYLPLPTFCHPLSPLDILTFLHLLWLMKKHRFDIVHTNSSKPGFIGRLAAKICRVPLIVHTAHGTAFQQNQSPSTYRFYQTLEKLGNLLSHKTIYVNNSDREACLALGLISPDKAVTIFNAIPTNLSNLLSQIALQRQMAVTEVIIGSTIRFSTQKNAVNLIIAACHACRKTPNLKFIILGQGEHYKLCQAIVHSCNCSSRVILPGWDSNIIPWLKVFHAFVLYSRWEALPFSIIEAMSSGLAVIGSDLPAISELCDNSTGYLVALDDSKALEAVFAEVARDYAPAFTKGKAAALQINKLCNYQNMVSLYREIYLE